MAQYNFEGDTTSFNERHLDFINKVVHEQNLKVKKVVFQQLGQAGDNFMGNVKRINIEGDNGSMKMIVKVAPTNETSRQTYHSELMFKNEHLMYTKVFPKFVELQKAAGVPPEEHLKFAKCYGSLNEEPNEIIIFEDLNESGYSMFDKFTSLPDKYVRNFLKTFAVLHSLSYVLKTKEPEMYNQLKDDLKDAWGAMGNLPVPVLTAIESGFLEIIQEEAHRNFLKNKLVEACIDRQELTESDKDRKHTIIQHGDAWTNNILFKVVDDSVQSVMVDYQGANHNNPLCDVLFMIFHCTDYEARSKNFYVWIDYYLSELDKFLSYFGLKANDFYPRDQLDADLKKYCKTIFGVCVVMSNVILRSTEESGEFIQTMHNMENESDMVETMKTQGLNSETVARMNKKVVGLIDTIHEFNLM